MDTGWQYRVKPRSAAELAREAIPLLEAAINRRFGVIVDIGAELEFSVIPASPALCDDPLGFGDKPDGISPVHLLPANRKPYGKPALLGESPAVAYGYREEAPVSEWQTYQYEYSFTHQTGRDAQFLADEIADTKAILQGKAPIYRDNDRISANLREKFPSSYIKAVFFAPTLPYYRANEPFTPRPYPDGSPANDEIFHRYITHGLHINLSVRTADQSFTQLKEQSWRYAGHLRDCLFRAFHFGLLAIDSAGSADRRVSPSNQEKYAYANAIEIIRFPERIENRLADARADPHITIMLNLVGIYQGLGEIEKDQAANWRNPQRSSVQNRRLPVYRNEQMASFAKEKLITATLNQVDPAAELGTCFHHAVWQEKVLAPGLSGAQR